MDRKICFFFFDLDSWNLKFFLNLEFILLSFLYFSPCPSFFNFQVYQEFYYLYFYYLHFNNKFYFFKKLIKIVIIPNSIASCSLSLSLSRAIKNGQRGRNRGANFHFISMKGRGREGGIFFIVEIRKTKPIETHVKSLPRRAHCNPRISPPFAHYIIQQVNCHASSNIHYEPVNGSLLHRLNFAQTFSNLAKQSAKLFATMRKHASIFFFFFLLFLLFFFSNDYHYRMNVRYSLTIGKLSNRQISVSISSLESISNVSEWKFRSVSKIDDEKNEKKRKKERNGIR